MPLTSGGTNSKGNSDDGAAPAQSRGKLGSAEAARNAPVCLRKRRREPHCPLFSCTMKLGVPPRTRDRLKKESSGSARIYTDGAHAHKRQFACICAGFGIVRAELQCYKRRSFRPGIQAPEVSTLCERETAGVCSFYCVLLQRQPVLRPVT